MHDIWNPWHGCVKCSEGCQNCYMYFLDRVRDKAARIFIKQNQDLTILCKKTVTAIIKCRAVSLFAYV